MPTGCDRPPSSPTEGPDRCGHRGDRIEAFAGRDGCNVQNKLTRLPYCRSVQLVHYSQRQSRIKENENALMKFAFHSTKFRRKAFTDYLPTDDASKS